MVRARTVVAILAVGALAAPAQAATAPSPPARIVSLSPTATEDLFAINAGTQVIAVDDQSTFPKAAPRTKLSGFKPNVEAIARYKPDLVVIANDTGKLVAQLKKLKIRVLIQPAATDLAQVYAEITQLGAATGHRPKAARLVASMKSRIAAIVASVPARATPLTYYHELDPTFYSVTSSTFIGKIYSLLGLKNIADDATGAESGYPQLSSEAIVAKNPSLVFLADTKCCQINAAAVAARPGWSNIAAVTNGGVVELDDDIASRWGPRVVSFLKTVADRVAGLK